MSSCKKKVMCLTFRVVVHEFCVWNSVCEHICANNHTWLRCLQREGASLCICLTGATRSSCEEPASFPKAAPHLCHLCLPAPSRCVSLTSLASFHLWHYSSLASTLPSSPTAPTSCFSRHLSLTCHFFHQLLVVTFSQQPRRRRERNHRSENGDHFVPVGGFAASKSEAMTDSHFTLKHGSPWQHCSLKNGLVKYFTFFEDARFCRITW